MPSVSYFAQSMGTLITCLNVELDEADPLKPAKGRTARASIRCVASCVPLGPARGRTAASVCCAASGVPERVASGSVVVAWAQSI